MNTKTEIIGAIVLVVVIVGLVLWYMSEHPAPYINQGNATSTASGQVPAGKDGAPATINESAAYYEIQAKYPSSTSLRTTASATADAKAVAAMKGFEQNTIDAFKEQGNFANLTHDDVQMMGLDQRKESLSIAYVTKRGARTVSYVYTIYQDTLGAHPNAYYRTFTFDTKTGGGLTLDDVFASGVDYNGLLSAATRKALPAIVAAHEGVSVSDVDPKMIASGTLPEADSFQNWYIEGSDLVIIFPPYQVAPYAAGEIEVRLPFASLSSSLNSAYK